VDGAAISDRRIFQYLKTTRPYLKKNPCTFFEVTTALAFWHFHREAVEYAVVEVGLGGRLDSTNVITPQACAITSISLDHQEYLGHSLGAIAREKAGIIKPGVPVYLPRSLPPAALKSIRAVAKIKKAPVKSIRVIPGLKKNKLAMPGSHQNRNLSLALAILRDLSILSTDKKIIKEMAGVVMPGRFQVVSWKGRRVILDGAHNPQAIKTCLESIRHLGFGQPPLLIFACMKDKPLTRIISLINRFNFAAIFLPRLPLERASTPEILIKMGLPGTVLPFGKGYLRQVINQPGTGRNTPIVAMGSFYLLHYLSGELKLNLS
jgi:dihydrofolate synthase/folylpolyglutamate synthase